MVSRKEIDGRDRTRVFEALRSFDATGLDGSDFARRVCGLMDFSSLGFSEPRASADPENAARRLCAHFAERAQPECRESTEAPSSQGADEIMRNVFTFYGETHDLGRDFDWDSNPGTRHWGHDLNRFTYLEPLVGAFLRTGDLEYAQKAVGLILDWIAKTYICDAFIPDKSPFVWGSYLNIKGHLGAWAHALELLLPHNVIGPEDLLRVLKSVHDQLAYLEIVIPEHSNNWVVFGSEGMLTTATFFPELRDSGRWIDYAWARMTEQIDHQILPDGVQFELTPHYHFGVARSYVTAITLSSRAGRSVPDAARRATQNMTHYLEQTVTPDGFQLSLNDSDANRGGDIIDFLRSEQTVAACGEAAPRTSSGTAFGDLPSEAFPFGGVYFLRDTEHYLAFDGGPFGASHQHEDKLSFWLAAHGRSMIVDAGRYLYDNSNPFRPYLLTTQPHNTVLVDGGGQCSRRFPKYWVSRRPLENYWNVSENTVQAGASYEFGFGEEGKIPVVHRRSVSFVGGSYYLLFDRLEGEGDHDVELRFQLMPGTPIAEGDHVHTTWDDANVLIWPMGDGSFDLSINVGETDPISGWYSAGYNCLEPAPQLIFRHSANLPTEFVTLLLPYPGTEPPDTSFRDSSDGYEIVLDGRTRLHTRENLARFSAI